MKKFVANCMTVTMICGQVLLVQAEPPEFVRNGTQPPGFRQEDLDSRTAVNQSALENALLRIGPNAQEEEIIEPIKAAPQAPQVGNVEELREGFDYYPDGLLKTTPMPRARRQSIFMMRQSS